MKVGQHVQADLDENVVVIGVITEVREGEVDIKEAHAFHRLWGGSNVGRGGIVTASRDKVKQATGNWDRIIRDVKEKW